MADQNVKIYLIGMEIITRRFITSKDHSYFTFEKFRACDAGEISTMPSEAFRSTI